MRGVSRDTRGNVWDADIAVTAETAEACSKWPVIVMSPEPDLSCDACATSPVRPIRCLEAPAIRSSIKSSEIEEHIHNGVMSTHRG